MRGRVPAQPIGPELAVTTPAIRETGRSTATAYHFKDDRFGWAICTVNDVADADPVEPAMTDQPPPPDDIPATAPPPRPRRRPPIVAALMLAALAPYSSPAVGFTFDPEEPPRPRPPAPPSAPRPREEIALREAPPKPPAGPPPTDRKERRAEQRAVSKRERNRRRRGWR